MADLGAPRGAVPNHEQYCTHLGAAREMNRSGARCSHRARPSNPGVARKKAATGSFCSSSPASGGRSPGSKRKTGPGEGVDSYLQWPTSRKKLRRRGTGYHQGTLLRCQVGQLCRWARYKKLPCTHGPPPAPLQATEQPQHIHGGGAPKHRRRAPSEPLKNPPPALFTPPNLLKNLPGPSHPLRHPPNPSRALPPFKTS